MRIRLVKKLAEVLNDFDLTDKNVGDVFDCSQRDGRMLVLEGWAEFVNGALLTRRIITTPESGSLENAQLSQSIWQLIDLHREGKKDKLA